MFKFWDVFSVVDNSLGSLKKSRPTFCSLSTFLCAFHRSLVRHYEFSSKFIFDVISKNKEK